MVFSHCTKDNEISSQLKVARVLLNTQSCREGLKQVLKCDTRWKQ